MLSVWANVNQWCGKVLLLCTLLKRRKTFLEGLLLKFWCCAIFAGPLLLYGRLQFLCEYIKLSIFIYFSNIASIFFSFSGHYSVWVLSIANEDAATSSFMCNSIAQNVALAYFLLNAFNVPTLSFIIFYIFWFGCPSTMFLSLSYIFLIFSVVVFFSVGVVTMDLNLEYRCGIFISLKVVNFFPQNVTMQNWGGLLGYKPASFLVLWPYAPTVHSNFSTSISQNFYFKNVFVLSSSRPGLYHFNPKLVFSICWFADCTPVEKTFGF